MELHFQAPIDRAYDAIEDALRRGAESWLPQADLKDDKLTAELTFDPGGQAHPTPRARDRGQRAAIRIRGDGAAGVGGR